MPRIGGGGRLAAAAAAAAVGRAAARAARVGGRWCEMVVMVVVVVVDGRASVGRGCGGGDGRQLQLDEHHVIAQAHRQIQRSFARKEIVHLIAARVNVFSTKKKKIQKEISVSFTPFPCS